MKQAKATEVYDVKTTKRQYEEFKSRCLELRDVLNLRDWNIAFEHKDVGDANASVTSNAQARTATICLNLVITCGDGDCIESGMIKRMANHEMFHVFLATLEDLGSCRWAHDDELKIETERMCRVMEGVL